MLGWDLEVTDPPCRPVWLRGWRCCSRSVPWAPVSGSRPQRHRRTANNSRRGWRLQGQKWPQDRGRMDRAVCPLHVSPCIQPHCLCPLCPLSRAHVHQDCRCDQGPSGCEAASMAEGTGTEVLEAVQVTSTMTRRKAQVASSTGARGPGSAVEGCPSAPGPVQLLENPMCSGRGA